MKLNWTTIVNISRPQQSIICILKAAIQIDSVSAVEWGRGWTRARALRTLPDSAACNLRGAAPSSPLYHQLPPAD